MQKELKEILKKEGKTGKDLAEELGMSYVNYRRMTMSKKKNPPFWVSAFVAGYNLKSEEK